MARRFEEELRWLEEIGEPPFSSNEKRSIKTVTIVPLHH